MTNAIQAAIVAFINAAGGLLIAFGVVLTDAQLGGIVTVVNTGLALYFIARHSQVKPKV